jgi:HK97 family phage major capsid protein
MPVIQRPELGAPLPSGSQPGIIPVQYATGILQEAAVTSVAMREFPNVSVPTGVMAMPVLAALPKAYWVTETPLTGAGNAATKKPTTSMGWTNVILQLAELAAIVVIPEAVLEDATIDLWAQIRPRLAEAIAVAVDEAVFFGNASTHVQPAGWPKGLVELAITAGNTSAAVDTDYYASFSKALQQVEEDGFNPTDWFTSLPLRSALRNVRDLNGLPMYATSLRDGVSYNDLFGVDLNFVNMASWDEAKALALVGDSSKVIIGTSPSGMQWKVLDQASIDISAALDGSAIVNLAQQDLVALRVRFRVGYAVANAATVEFPSGSGRFPFAVMTPDVTP